MKKIELMQVYNILNGAKLTKMEDADKFIVIKIMREVKPVVTEITDAIEVAKTKLKADDHDALQEKAQKWNELSEEDKIEINKYFTKYNKDVDEAVKDLAETEMELTNHIGHEAFEKLVSSNDFDVATIMKLEDAIVK